MSNNPKCRDCEVEHGVSIYEILLDNGVTIFLCEDCLVALNPPKQ